MRPEYEDIVTDHDQLLDVGPDDHHTNVCSFSWIINGLSISPGDYYHRIDLDGDGYKTIVAVMRGVQKVEIQGYAGVYVQGTDTALQSIATSIKPYGGGGYLTSYMGAYARLHGDSFLSPPMFNWGIRLHDLYIDTGVSPNQAVFRYYNPQISARLLKTYGLGFAK